MFAIGLLSLLGMGVAMSMSGGADDVDADQSAGVESDTDTNENTNSSRGDVFIDFTPEDDIDPEVEDQINGFIEGVEENPDRPIEEVVDELHNFLNGLDDGEDSEDVAEDEDEDVAVEDDSGSFVAPPMGDAYRDPIIVAEELEAQRIADEIAAEEARQPENLVTVSASNGDEVSDDAVLVADPEEGEEAYIVTAPEGANDIEIGYDHERTFDVTYNEDTGSIVIGLNSDLQGPEGTTPRSITNEPDEDGVVVRELTWTKEFENSTDITLQVELDHIGTHMAQIDLTNPNDTLHFEFGEEMTGNLHLVYSEVEEGAEGDTSTVMRAFVIHTDDAISSLSDNDVARILAAGEDGFDGATIMTEIYLGEDSLFVNGEPGSGEPYELRITNFINDDPAITSSIEWTSVTDYDEDNVAEAQQGTGTGSGSEGSGEYEEPSIEELLENAGINPDFFGIPF